MPSVEKQPTIDTIVMLAEQIAHTAPECAIQAMRIIELVNELGSEPDRAMIRDAIEAETADSDLSNARVQTTAEAVARAIRTES
jgi:hypothetical protein